MHARIDGVVDEGLLIRGDRAVDVTLRGLRVAEPDEGVRVEGPQLDRLAVGLDRLIEEAPRLREIEIAQRLVRLWIGGVELRCRAELCRGLPAVPERRVHDAERVGGDDEARVDLDRPGQQIHGRFVALLVGTKRRDLATREQLEGPRHARWAGRLFDPTGFSVGRGHAERASVHNR